jgi:DinB superfamily
MTPDQIFITTAISSWQQVVTRIGALCLGLNEEQLLVEIAPGKNRILYLWGHLTAIDDAMFTVLRLGERLHPELDAIFVKQPDRSMPLPASAEIAKSWDAIHTALPSRFTTLGPHEWLERHGSVSAEEFEQNPARNRLAVLLSRTNHASYHLGQMMLAKPRTA